MTQPRLKLRTSRANSVTRQQATMERANSIAAAIITANPESFGGEGSLAVIWARAFQERVQSERLAA